MFELWPEELRALLDAEAEGDRASSLGPGLDGELLDDDSEITGDDEDAFVEEEPADLSLWVSPVTTEALALRPDPGPFLDLSRLYCLSVAPLAEGTSISCTFDPPGWMSRPAGGRLSDHVGRLIAFLQAVAAWLEKSYQPFLRDPSPARFAEGQGSFSDAPIVLQDGFRGGINEGLSGHHRVGKSEFTRLLPKIWFLWPRRSLPLRALFSREYRAAWVAAGCLRDLEPGQWVVTRLSRPTKAQLEGLERRDFANLAQEERLHLLSRRARVRAEEALRVVLERRTDVARSAPQSVAGLGVADGG